MIEIGKQYRTRDGSEVRIYATDGGAPQPVHGAYLQNGQWIANTWNAHGDHRRTGGESTFDLVEVKPKRTLNVWVNEYRNETCLLHKSREDADLHAYADRIACLHIVREYEEGEGL